MEVENESLKPYLTSFLTSWKSGLEKNWIKKFVVKNHGIWHETLKGICNALIASLLVYSDKFRLASGRTKYGDSKYLQTRMD